MSVHNSHIVPDLVKALAKGQAAVFVGAGLSAGAGLPDWSGLVAQLAKEADVPEDWSFLMIAEAFLKLPNGRHTLIRRIQERLLATALPTETHKIVARLPVEFFITTNYDLLFDKALEEVRGRAQPVWSSRQLPFSGAVVYIKLHGDLNDPESIVLTKTDYRNLFRREKTLYTALQNLFATRTMLFLGYSHRDPDMAFIIDEVCHELDQYRPPVYSVQFDLDAAAVRHFDLNGITVINLHARDTSSAAKDEALREFLEEVGSDAGWAVPTTPAVVSVATFSTGQALEAVKSDLVQHVRGQPAVSPGDVMRIARECQEKQRGRMVPFEDFTRLGREFSLMELIRDGEFRNRYLIEYLETYFAEIVGKSLAQCSENLAKEIGGDDVLVIAEYSRVIRTALEKVAKKDPELFSSLTFVIVNRKDLLLQRDEPDRMANEIAHLGASPKRVSFERWMELISAQEPDAELPRIDKVLFGAEAFLASGELLFPQNIKQMEVSRLANARHSGGSLRHATIIAAGESYKVFPRGSEIMRLDRDAHYSVIPHSTFDLIVTDVRSFSPGPDGQFDLRPCLLRVERACDSIRSRVWPERFPLPLRNLSDEACRAFGVCACDIDGTITDGHKLTEGTIRSLLELSKHDVSVILVTGRSGGWAAALACYLPGLCGVIAENGGVYVRSNGAEVTTRLLGGLAEKELPAVRGALQRCFSEVRRTYPDAQEASDNHTRITDFAIQLAPAIDPADVAKIAERNGLGFTYSSVHLHLQGSHCDKGTALCQVLSDEMGFLEEEVKYKVITIGDSINDAPLFNVERFKYSVGVRNILPEIEALGDKRPRFVTLRTQAQGFGEVAEQICQSRACGGARES